MKWNLFIIRDHATVILIHERLAAALVNDIERERNVEESEEIDEIESFPADDDDCDVDYVPNEDDASDTENEVVIEPNDLFDSDEEFTESETQNLCTSTSEEFFYGKDGTKWEKNEPNTGVRIRQHNVMRFKSGPKERNSVPVEIQYKNEMRLIQVKKKKIWKDVTESELDAFIGILLAAGVSHNNTQKSEVLMAYRWPTDIQSSYNYMNENLAKNYSPYENITIDEQLFPYRGKTKFTQYISSKPAKYGIKIWWACDSKTKYALLGKLYTGRQEGNERETNQEGAKRLTKIGLTFVGTIRSNKICIPEEMRKHTSRIVLSSRFGFNDNLVSICRYVPKKNKCVNLLSTVHYTKCEDEAKKPETILFYNKNKGGVDCMDQMVTHFTSKRATKRWTFAFFCNMLYVMALAVFCICKEIDGTKISDARRNFLWMLSNTLALPNIEQRMQNVHINKQFSSRSAFESFFGRPMNISIHIQLHLYFPFSFSSHFFCFRFFFCFRPHQK
ncbi:hypothetical protein QTP88_005476 [Uroleucon formosanum]